MMYAYESSEMNISIIDKTRAVQEGIFKCTTSSVLSFSSSFHYDATKNKRIRKTVWCIVVEI